MEGKVVLYNTRLLGENSMTDIRNYFAKDAEPLKEGEFKEFWMSLSEAERDEFRKADLSK